MPAPSSGQLGASVVHVIVDYECGAVLRRYDIGSSMRTTRANEIHSLLQSTDNTSLRSEDLFVLREVSHNTLCES
jgi:hypothetical protein